MSNFISGYATYSPLLSVLLLASTCVLAWLFNNNKRIATAAYEESRMSKSQLEVAQNMRVEIEKIRDEYILRYEQEKAAHLLASTELAARSQELNDFKIAMADWDKVKEEHLKAAQAALYNSSRQLSTQLLEEHKKESATHNEANQKRVDETAQKINLQFEKITNNLATISKEVDTVRFVKDALLSPQGAGHLGEITMENLLKNSALRENDDYVLQPVIITSERAFKPDALVKLPGDHVMLIDSKASKFFFEITSAGENIDLREAAQSRLKESMQKHLKDLKARDYLKAFTEHDNPYTKSPIQELTMVMFLPSDSALETLLSVDKEFYNKAVAEKILVVGPAGLVNLLIHSHLIISRVKQQENFEQIKKEVEKLLKNLHTLHQHADNFGKGLRGLFEKFDKFSASYNRNVVSGANRLSQLGVMSKESQLKRLSAYEVVGKAIDSDDYETIESPTLIELEKEPV